MTNAGEGRGSRDQDIVLSPSLLLAKGGLEVDHRAQDFFDPPAIRKFRSRVEISVLPVTRNLFQKSPSATQAETVKRLISSG